jgi:hypothetical protein
MAGAKMSAGQTVILILATLLHLVIGYFYLVTGLMAPVWGVGLLLLIWLGLTIWGYRNRHRALVILVPLVAVAVWFVVLSLGEILLGWTA